MKKKQPQEKEPETYEEFLANEWKHFNIHYKEYDANVPPSNYPLKERHTGDPSTITAVFLVLLGG